MIPIRITARMLGPVAYTPGEGLTIDGPLAYAAMLERLGEEFFAARPPNDALACAMAEPDPAVPLAVHSERGVWMYCASLAEAEGEHPSDLVHWNKRFDDALAQRALEAGGLAKLRQIRLNSGELKSYHMPLWLEHAELLVWYAVGDPDEVLRLLKQHVTHLGKKRHAGHGAVAGWEVEAWGGRPDRWLWRDDARTIPARAIPLALLDGWSGETAWAGVRPPYWLLAHQAECAVAR